MLKAFHFGAVLSVYFTSPWLLQNTQQPPITSGPRPNVIYTLRCLAIPFPNFCSGSKSVKFGFTFWANSSFSWPHFETQQDI